MASKELVTKIILKGMTDPSLSQAFKNADKLANNHINTVKKVGESVKKIAKIGAVAVAAGLGASAKAAIDYESAFAGVMKTVEETGTTTYEDLSNSIRQMAKEMPASASEIAGVAEVAGQLGIKADDIAKFSKTMINLGETTNIVAEDAASTIAKYFNVTKTGMQDVDKFGSTLVALGNNAATTEADIMEMASRIGATGSMIGLSNQEILALSTSLSSVGLAAEGGGTAISTVLSKIDKEVASNGKTLSTWASLAGMSADKFKSAWQKDTMGTIQKIVNGMGNAQKGGTNLNLILDELGITGIRTSDTMKRLTNASDLMGDMVSLANTAWEENSALTTEAQTRYNTVASKIQILKNKLTDVAITVGNKLMPVIDKIITKMDEINWDAVGQKICDVIQWVVDNFDLLLSIITVVASAFVAFKVASFIQGIIQCIQIIKTLTTTFGLLNTVMSMNIFAIIVAAIVALVAAFVMLWKKCDGFRNFFIGMWNGIKNAVSAVGSWIANFFTVTIPNAFNATINFFKQLPNKIWTWLVSVWNRIAQWGANLWAKAKEIGLNFVNGIINFFKDLPYKIGYLLGFAIGKIILFGKECWKFVTVTIPQVIGRIIEWFAKLPGRIWTWLLNTIAKIKQWGTQMISNAKTAVVGFVNNAINVIKSLPSKIWTWLLNTINKVKQWGSQMLTKAREGIVKVCTTIVNKIKELPQKMLELGKNIVQGLWNGIKNAKDWLIGKIKSFATGITDGICKALGIKSPSRVMMKIAKFIPMGIGVGIQKNTKYATDAIKDMSKKISKGASSFTPVIQTKIADISGNLPKFGKGGTVTSPMQAIVGDTPETIVPHGNTPRNRSLLMEAAKGVGVKPTSGSATYNFTFAPVINGGNASENKQMLEEEYDKFKQMMDNYLAEKGALAY